MEFFNNESSQRRRTKRKNLKIKTKKLTLDKNNYRYLQYFLKNNWKTHVKDTWRAGDDSWHQGRQVVALSLPGYFDLSEYATSRGKLGMTRRFVSRLICSDQ